MEGPPSRGPPFIALDLQAFFPHVVRTGKTNPFPIMRILARRTSGQQDCSGTSSAALKAAILPLVNGQTILDLGCGKGSLAEALRRARAGDPKGPPILYGMDLSRNAEIAQRAHALYDVFLRAGPVHVPFPDQSADVVLGVELIEHLLPGELAPVLGEMERVSRGRAILTTPAPYYCIQPGFLLREMEETLARQSPMGLREYVEKALGVHKQVIYPPDLISRGYRLLRGRLGYPRVVAGSLIYVKDRLAASRGLPGDPRRLPEAGDELDEALYTKRLAREIPFDRERLRRHARVDDATWAQLGETAKTGDHRLAYLNILAFSASLRDEARNWRANRSVWPSFLRATVKTALWRVLNRFLRFRQPG
jgi:SAM-dependent methyltransferase